jgi:hypothetical protein
MKSAATAKRLQLVMWTPFHLEGELVIILTGLLAGQAVQLVRHFSIWAWLKRSQSVMGYKHDFTPPSRVRQLHQPVEIPALFRSRVSPIARQRRVSTTVSLDPPEDLSDSSTTDAEVAGECRTILELTGVEE